MSSDCHLPAARKVAEAQVEPRGQAGPQGTGKDRGDPHQLSQSDMSQNDALTDLLDHLLKAPNQRVTWESTPLCRKRKEHLLWLQGKVTNRYNPSQLETGHPGAEFLPAWCLLPGTASNPAPHQWLWVAGQELSRAWGAAGVVMPGGCRDDDAWGLQG